MRWSWRRHDSGAADVKLVLPAAAWGISPKDVPLLDLLKHLFHRTRPGYGSVHSGTFSLPSGCGLGLRCPVVRKTSCTVVSLAGMAQHRLLISDEGRGLT